MQRKTIKILLGLTIMMFLFSLATAESKTEPRLDPKDFAVFVNKTLAEWNVPGVGVAVVKGNKVILAEGYGLRDVHKKLAVTSQTIFPIGSASKAFTATAVGILVDEEKLSWDRPVKDYLPSIQLHDQLATIQITPRDLLCHRSGVPRHDLAWIGSTASRKELFDRIRFLEPNAGFRSIFQYNNFMYLAAGYLVGKVSGSSWEAFVKSRILEPLEMKDSVFSVEDSMKKSDFALPYGLKKDQVVELPFRKVDAMGPAGSINSNVLDMAQWILFNINKGKIGEKSLISESTLAEIHSPQVVIKQGEFRLLENFPEMSFSTYGLGWVISNYRGHIWIHHGGNIDGFTTLETFFPRDDIGVIVLSNMNGTFVPDIISLNIADRLFGLDQVDWNKRVKDIFNKMEAAGEKAEKEKDKDRKLGTQPSHPLEEYVGDYENPGYGIVSVIKDSDGLRLETPELEFDGPLSHYHYDIFELKATIIGYEMQWKVAFSTDLKGNINSLSIKLEQSANDIVFVRNK